MTTTQQQIAPAITAGDEDSIREWANVTEASVDADGDVWIEGPCVGHWLSAERKAQYLEWRAAQS